MDMEQTLYDVFISYSRKDYVDEHGNIIPGNIISQIKDSFQNAGIHYWFDEEGIYSGDKYMEKLADAIFASTAFVFISSINSNASEWTAGEIGTAHLYKKKIIPFRLDDSPFARSVIVKIAHLDYIDCNPNPDKAIMDLVGSILAARDEEEKKQREEEERRNKERMKARRAEIQQEIQNLASDLRRVGSQQQNVIDQIIAQKAMLEETDKICPVCQKKAQLSQRYCERCGFTYPILYGLADNDTDTIQLVTLRGVWKDASSQQTKQQELRNDNIRLKGIIEKQSQQLQKLEKDRKNLENLQHLLDAAKKEITEYVNKLKESEESYSKLSSLLTCRDQELKESHSEIKEYMEKIASYRKTIGEQKEKIDILTRELDAERKDAEERKREEERKRREGDERKPREEEARAKERVFRVGGVEFKMIRVEGGTFMMGSPDSDSDAYDDEKPQHRVTLSDYYIGEIPVTQALWQAVMGGNPSYSQGVNNPVESVSWNDCQEFFKKLNQQTGMTFSLPTEAQWEYAARGGNKSKGYKYAGSNSVKDVAWYRDNSGGMTHPVKGKRANELGLYDMSGNVWEWCQDWLGSYSSTPQTNPIGPATGSRRVLRGGSWNNYARSCRVADRISLSPGLLFIEPGFRLSLVHPKRESGTVL